MGQFKPMVKMETTEPSVELKLKKGGHVNFKKGGSAKAEHGHKKMHHMMGGGVMNALANTPALVGRPAVNAPVAVPSKPSMAMRRKAMMAKPAMPMGRPMPPTMGRPMPPAMGHAPMKKGGKAKHHAEGGDIAQDKAMIKKAFKEHDSQEHKGGKGTHLTLKKGGKVHHISGHPEGSHEHHKHMAKHHAQMHKEGGSAHHKKMAEHHKAMCSGGKYAKGGSVVDETTKGKYVTTEMHEAGPQREHGPTGMVKEGNAGGYKRGGKVHHKAVGGHIPDEASYGSYATTKVDEAGRQSEHGPTGGVKEEQGGYKRGGHTKKHHYAMGGHAMNYVDDNVSGTPAGVKNMTTGGVKEANAGGYKHGGKAHMKKFAKGGNVNDSGKAMAMPQGRKHPSEPVHINELSGTFKRGGRAKKC